VDAEQAVLHDPDRGPAIRIARQDLLRLWRATERCCEVVGRVLVAFGQDPPPAVPCAHCGAALPTRFVCRRCEREVPTQPTAVLGCAAAGCRGRLWERIFCPFCDTDVADLGV
jgi:hypothetical protein